MVYIEKLGGGARLLYNLNGKDLLWNERKLGGRGKRERYL